MVQCVNLPPGSWPIALGTGATRVLGVGACCWQSGRSALAVARSASVSRNARC